MHPRDQNYEAFGQGVHTGTVEAVRQPFGFAGRESDRTAALMYYRTRQYDPRIGVMRSRNWWGYIHRNASLYDAMDQSPVQHAEPFSEVEPRPTLRLPPRAAAMAAWIAFQRLKDPEYCPPPPHEPTTIVQALPPAPDPCSGLSERLVALWRGQFGKGTRPPTERCCDDKEVESNAARLHFECTRLCPDAKKARLGNCRIATFTMLGMRFKAAPCFRVAVRKRDWATGGGSIHYAVEIYPRWGNVGRGVIVDCWVYNPRDAVATPADWGGRRVSDSEMSGTGF
jgi:RHS repeat-associated protein